MQATSQPDPDIKEMNILFMLWVEKREGENFNIGIPQFKTQKHIKEINILFMLWVKKREWKILTLVPHSWKLENMLIRKLNNSFSKWQDKNTERR